MKHLHFFCALCIIALGLSSCSKEETYQVITPQEPDASTYLKSLPNDVVLHYQFRPDAASEVHGWFIDKFGQVKSYTSSSLIQGASITRQQMENLYAKAQLTHLSIAPEEFAPRVKTLLRLNDSTLSTPQLDDTRTSQLLIQAYRSYDAKWKPNSCSERPASGAYEAMSDKFEIVLLKAEGYINQQNIHVNAQDLLGWLQVLQQNAGL